MTKFNKELIVQPNVGVFCKTKEESYQLREFSLTHFNNGVLLVKQMLTNYIHLL